MRKTALQPKALHQFQKTGYVPFGVDENKQVITVTTNFHIIQQSVQTRGYEYEGRPDGS